MKRLLTTLFLLVPMYIFAQMPKAPEVAWITINDSLYPIPAAQTQTEIKPGLKIADVTQLPDKKTRYVWGAKSRQLTDGNMPRFVLRTQAGTLHDFVILKLKEKKQYRQFPKAEIHDCTPIYIDLFTFKIEMLPDERYAITPLKPMQPGEYAIIDTSAKPINEFGDITVYGFTITDNK